MKKYIKIVALFLFVSIAVTSCTKDFEEMNTSRSLVLQEIVDIDMMFTRVLVTSILNGENGSGTTGNWAGMSVSGANRPFATGASAGVWSDTYGNYTRNLSDIVEITRKREDAENLVNKRSIARIYRVWAFAKCTDTYGDIPYFESGLPVEDAISTPKYDLQRDIYLDFFKELREAVAEFDDTKPSFGNADILYKGNLDKWRKFANSLRLRLALRVRYVDAAMSAEQMADLTEDDLIIKGEDDAYILNSDDLPEHQNTRYNDLVARKATVDKSLAAKTFLDILKNNNDPRLHVFLDTVTAQFPQTPGYEDVPYFGYRGRPLLSGESQQEGYAYGDNTVSKLSDLFWVKIQEFPLYRSSETYFNLAEAALFNVKSGDAQAFYKKGIELAMLQTKKMYEDAVPQLPEVVALFHTGQSEEVKINALTDVLADKEITQGQIDEFLNNEPTVTLTGTNEQKLEQIINQKIIGLFPMEHEGWTEHRRTGYPRILVGVENSPLQGRMPRRMPYPASEQLINSEQYQIALERLGGEGKDERTTNIWWQANPDPYKEHPEVVETRTTPWISQ
tara:strand:- start:8945 stop:10633 length:1689 start_codon:yes stop_codon:yes gene_type:complete